MSRLAIFDIDGTLTDTNLVDDECFLRAFAESCDVEQEELDWSGAPHVTDSAIAHWLWQVHRGRAASDDEVEQLVQRFVGILEEECARAPERFLPIAGVVGLFDALQADGWDVAVATGGWTPSARFKLAVAGIELPELVLATATDALSREEIVQAARARAEEKRGDRYARVVSVGDAVWDVRTAAALGLPFVGIAVGARADALRAVGATVVLPDYRDRAAVCDALETAVVSLRATRTSP
jgi:phosphoglycolate phosphatase-like HAD superfamily hydrolase